MRNHVFIVAEGAQHLAAADVVAKTLAEAGIPVCLVHPHVLDERKISRAYRWAISDIYAVPGALKHCALVLFFTHESSPYCMFSNKVGFAARLTGTPSLTIQHGWIQPGLNFAADTRRIGYVGRGSDNAPAIAQFSKVLTYDGSDGIGYPLLPADFAAHIRLPIRVDARVLLATNFNWGVYSRESMIGFLRAVSALKAEFAGFTFSHRPHAAEKSQGIAAELGVYLDMIGAATARADLEEALAAADFVITTPSTIALDALGHGLPAFVYCPREFDSAADLLGAARFTTTDELIEKARSLFAEKSYSPPPVHAFRSDQLIEHVRAACAAVGPYELTDENYLRFVQLVK